MTKAEKIAEVNYIIRMLEREKDIKTSQNNCFICYIYRKDRYRMHKVFPELYDEIMKTGKRIYAYNDKHNIAQPNNRSKFTFSSAIWEWNKFNKRIRLLKRVMNKLEGVD